jgi:radical SAM enzyme (TIGR01210 family)
MCSYLLDGSVEKPTADQLVEQFQNALGELKDSISPLGLKVYTSGSFLDSEEVPVEARDDILRVIGADERITEVVLESRPEFVTEDTMSTVHTLLGSRHVEIGIGLESANDDIRSLCINKGFSTEDFERAVKVAKKHSIGVRSYILLKPPFLTEHAALEDAIETIVHAAKVGVTTISVNPVNIQKHTLVEQLWTRGQYRPPWLWTLLEVLKRTRAEIDATVPIICDPVAAGRARGVHNCGRCDSQITDAIRKFSIEQESEVFSDLECGCINLWHHVLEHEDIALLVHTHRLER